VGARISEGHRTSREAASRRDPGDYDGLDMASLGGPPTSNNRPATAPLGVPPSRGPIVAAVLVLVGVTFLVVVSALYPLDRQAVV
jgi:hypothetical protein